MPTASFIAHRSQPPREINADDGITGFSAILQGNILILRLTGPRDNKKITFHADDFVQQMAWLLDFEEDAA